MAKDPIRKLLGSALVVAALVAWPHRAQAVDQGLVATKSEQAAPA